MSSLSVFETFPSVNVPVLKWPKCWLRPRFQQGGPPCLLIVRNAKVTASTAPDAAMFSNQVCSPCYSFDPFVAWRAIIAFSAGHSTPTLARNGPTLCVHHSDCLAQEPEPPRLVWPTGPARYSCSAGSCSPSLQGPLRRRPAHPHKRPLFTFAHPVSHPLGIVHLDFKRPPTNGRFIQI
jgi:hypothetical protein